MQNTCSMLSRWSAILELSYCARSLHFIIVSQLTTIILHPTRIHPFLQRSIFPCLTYTGHFIMFCVITNIYNKKTKRPTLMEFFTATGKLKKFFLTTRDVRCVHHGWRGTHRYNIQVAATHASTCWRVCAKKLGPLVFLS